MQSSKYHVEAGSLLNWCIYILHVLVLVFKHTYEKGDTLFNLLQIYSLLHKYSYIYKVINIYNNTMVQFVQVNRRSYFQFTVDTKNIHVEYR